MVLQLRERNDPIRMAGSAVVLTALALFASGWKTVLLFWVISTAAYACLWTIRRIRGERGMPLFQDGPSWSQASRPDRINRVAYVGGLTVAAVVVAITDAKFWILVLAWFALSAIWLAIGRRFREKDAPSLSGP
jgi:membrane protein implicated in regulation of membrane protease activity